MFDLLEPLFNYCHVDKQNADKFIYEFEEVIFLNLLARYQSCLNQETEYLIKENLKNKNFDGALKVMAANYTQTEWEQVLKTLGPIIQDYFSTAR